MCIIIVVRSIQETQSVQYDCLHWTNRIVSATHPGAMGPIPFVKGETCKPVNSLNAYKYIYIYKCNN